MEGNDDLELAIDELDEAPQKPSKMKKMILIAAPTVLVIGAGAAYYFMSGDAAVKGQVQQEATITGNVKAKAKARYFAIDPEFVVNLSSDSDDGRYLRIQVTLMTRDNDVIKTLSEHLPLMKNDLLSLFTSQSYAKLKSVEGKKQLRKDALLAVQTVMKDQDVKGNIESVLFTNFVME